MIISLWSLCLCVSVRGQSLRSLHDLCVRFLPEAQRNAMKIEWDSPPVRICATRSPSERVALAPHPTRFFNAYYVPYLIA